MDIRNNYKKIVSKINNFEKEISVLTDTELKNKTAYFKQFLVNGKDLDDVLPEAFAVVREVAKRAIGLRAFDVQLMGGIAIHQGKIAEMKTGEGKTLAAVMPGYLNALTGRGVHIITTNEYLARRDKEQMEKVFNFLGLSVGLIYEGMDLKERKKAYECDITYGTNNEFTFDYLRDNVVDGKSQIVQRELAYAIIDEIDSILIDEAESPLIISRNANHNKYYFLKANAFVRRLKGKEIVKEDLDSEEQADDNEKYDYIVDLNCNSVTLTSKGIKKVEENYEIENYNDIKNAKTVFYVNNALIACGLMKKDIDYVIKEGKIYVVDKYTGRIMYGKRFNKGLHQAIEAKEHLEISPENKVVATISFQNYFRMYKKISGMTGTATESAKEFEDIYGLKIVEIPTNKPVIRKDYEDIVVNSEKEKLEKIVEKIKEANQTGQPVLVGTVSIEKSERLSEMLQNEGIKHSVLNAKNHEEESKIIAQAGNFGQVTIATNMAGRGTDIKLENNEEVLEKGLLVIGTERHISSRIDKQLQGRSGRQGDPGASIFYVSLEDELMKLYGKEKINDVIKAIKFAQEEAENRHYSKRMLMIKYDDVINLQRELIYKERRKILIKEDIKSDILKMVDDLCERTANNYLAGKELNQMETALIQRFKMEEYRETKRSDFIERLKSLMHAQYEKTEETIGTSEFRILERGTMIKHIDEKWVSYLEEAEEMRIGIGLHAYKNVNPIIPYKLEISNMFNNFLEDIKDNAAMDLLFARRKN